MKIRAQWATVLLGFTMVAISGCDATRETLKAPFDATTAVSNGTTQGSSELTQPSKEFTSSTTPDARGGNDYLIRAKQRVQIFAGHNVDNLQHEIAQGRGEYLTSLVALAGIPADRYESAFAQLQKDYSVLYDSSSAPNPTHRLVDAVWTQPIGTH